MLPSQQHLCTGCLIQNFGQSTNPKKYQLCGGGALIKVLNFMLCHNQKGTAGGPGNRACTPKPEVRPGTISNSALFHWRLNMHVKNPLKSAGFREMGPPDVSATVPVQWGRFFYKWVPVNSKLMLQVIFIWIDQISNFVSRLALQRWKCDFHRTSNEFGSSIFRLTGTHLAIFTAARLTSGNVITAACKLVWGS